MLGEAPSTAMLTDLVTKANAGSTVQELADSLATNAAFTGQFPIWMTASEFTKKVVANMFAGSTVSQADTDAAVDYIAGMITAGTFTKTSAVVALTSYLASADGVANATYGTAAQSYQNKVEVAEYYTITSGQGGATAAERKAAISGVTATSDVAATTATIKAEGEAAAIEAAKVPGKVITLTNAAETVTGGAGDDTIVGVIAAAGGTTATSILPGDVINGGAGIDTLSINTSGDPTAADYSITAIQGTGIERISFNAFDTRDTNVHTMDLTLMGSDVTDIELASSSAGGDITITGSKSILDATMKNGSGDLTITYGAATVIGSADTQNLHVSNTTNGTFAAAGIETMAVTTSLATAKLAALTASGMTNLNVSGDQKLTVTAALDFKNSASGATAIDGTIDASGSTGGIDLTLTGGDNLAVTGSSGADSFRFGASGALGKNFYDTVNGGEGADTIFVSSAGTLGAAAANSFALAGLTSVETLDFTSTNNSAVLSMASMSADVNAVTVAGDAQAVTFTIGGPVNGTAIAFTLNGQSFTTAATDGSNNATKSAVLVNGVINADAKFTSTTTGSVVTVSAVSGATNNLVMSQPTGGATTSVRAAVKNIGVTNLKDDGSQAVTIHSGNDVSLALADGSGTEDVVNLVMGSITAERSLVKTVNTVTIGNTETLNISSTGNTDTVDNVISTLTADAKLATINVTGESDLDLTGTVTASRLVTLDASASTGDVSTDIPANAFSGSTVKGGAGKDSFIFAGGLRENDTVTGGDGVDKLSATVTGFTGIIAARGALNVTGVETLNLTQAGTAEINSAGIVGATSINLTGAATKTTLSNLDGTTAVGFGIYKTDGASSGRTDIALADATGTEDAISLVLNDTNGSNNNAIELRASGIETANISFGYNASTETTLADHTLDVDKLNATTITVTGSTYDVTNTLSLATLDTDTTVVDATTYSGLLTATAGAATAVSFTAKGGRVHNLTGNTKNDTFTMVGSMTNDAIVIDGAGGTGDVLNMTIGTGAQDFGEIVNVETINLTVSGSAVVSSNAATDDLDGLNAATKVVITGGNSLSTFGLGGATDVLTGHTVAVPKSSTIDASGYNGVITATYGADGFDDGELGYTQQFIGTASTTDVLTASYTSADDAIAINMQGVEVMNLSVGNGSALVASFAKTTGLTEINFTDASSEEVSFTGYDLGTTLDATTTNNTQVTITPTDASGAADTLSVKAKAGTGNDVLKLVVADVETVSIKADSANQVNLDVSGVTMTALGATAGLVFTGSNDIEITADNADITSINASTNLGGVVQTVRAATTPFTFTGSVGNDRAILMNVADVLNGSVGTGDTLDINKNAILGGMAINLNSTTNQLTSFNGSAVSGTVTGFESVDLLGYTGSFGAQVTGLSLAASTIVGSLQADQITGGAAGDTITAQTGTGSKDVINAGGGNDTIKITIASLADVSTAGNTQTINGQTGTDILEMLDAGTIADADLIVAQVTSIETLTLANGSQTATLAANAQAAGIRTVNGGTAADTVDMNAYTAAATINGGGGADIITAATGAITTLNVPVAAAVVTVKTSAITDAGYVNVTGFSVANDLFDFNGAVKSDDGNKTAVNGNEGADIADIASIGTAKVTANITAAMTTDVIDGFLAGSTSLAGLKTAALVAMADGTGIQTATTVPIAGLDIALADAAKVIIATKDGEDTALWYVNNIAAGTGGANTLAADEINLIGIVQGDELVASEVVTTFI
jgi:hypothetical protein